MQLYTYGHLTALLGERITMTDAQGVQAQLVIDHVEKNEQYGPDWEAFAVYLLGQDNLRIPQGCYVFEHPALGAETLFISPKSQLQYEVVINKRIAG